MVYKLSLTKSSDRFVEGVFCKSMKDLGKFYAIHWTTNTPKIVLLKDRKTIDLLRARKTEPWLVGWANGEMRIVFVLDRRSLGKYSSHKYSKEHYSSLIKHELSHLFYKILTGDKRGPVWLSEGVAIYTSGQHKSRTVPSEFKNFLTFYSHGGSGVYAESGFVVEILVRNFGKNKLLKLIKSLRSISDEKQFNRVFKRIYGFQISYRSINNYYTNSSPPRLRT